jgi:hypothetical protein
VLVSLLVGRTKFEREIATSYVSERIGLDCCVQPLLLLPIGDGVSMVVFFRIDLWKFEKHNYVDITVLICGVIEYLRWHHRGKIGVAKW